MLVTKFFELVKKHSRTYKALEAGLTKEQAQAVLDFIFNCTKEEQILRLKYIIQEIQRP